MDDKFLVGEFEDAIFVQFVGNATMKNSKTLEELFDKKIYKLRNYYL